MNLEEGMIIKSAAEQQSVNLLVSEGENIEAALAESIKSGRGLTSAQRAEAISKMSKTSQSKNGENNFLSIRYSHANRTGGVPGSRSPKSKESSNRPISGGGMQVLENDCPKCQGLTDRKPCLEWVEILRTEFFDHINELFRVKMKEFMAFIEETLDIED